VFSNGSGFFPFLGLQLVFFFFQDLSREVHRLRLAVAVEKTFPSPADAFEILEPLPSWWEGGCGFLGGEVFLLVFFFPLFIKSPFDR